MDPEYLRLIALIDAAASRRNLREYMRLQAVLTSHLMIENGETNQPIDLEKVRFIARMYAADIHGWEI